MFVVVGFFFSFFFLEICWGFFSERRHKTKQTFLRQRKEFCFDFFSPPCSIRVCLGPCAGRVCSPSYTLKTLRTWSGTSVPVYLLLP